jgi:hypothetical protein
MGPRIRIGFGLGFGLVLSLAACDDEKDTTSPSDPPSAPVGAELTKAEAAKSEDDPKTVEAKADTKAEAAADTEPYGQMSRPEPEPVPKPRPDSAFGAPTPDEFKAWDRAIPSSPGLYAWDEDNIATMLDRWEDLVCFREALTVAGEAGFGAKSGTKAEVAWFAFKRAFISELDDWQKTLFASDPRIIEKSRLVVNFLEAHELLMSAYPRAYNDADRAGVDNADAQWIVVEAKAEKVAATVGGTWREYDADPTAVAAHEAHCAALRTK